MLLQCPLRERDGKEKVADMHGFKKKRKFPNNWSDLSMEQVWTNIQYLLKNHKKYNVVLLGEDSIRIDNILICKKEVKILWHTYQVYDINKRMFTVDSDVGCSVTKLMSCCKQNDGKQSFIHKVKNWNKNFVENLINQRVKGL